MVFCPKSSNKNLCFSIAFLDEWSEFHHSCSSSFFAWGPKIYSSETFYSPVSSIFFIQTVFNKKPWDLTRWIFPIQPNSQAGKQHRLNYNFRKIYTFNIITQGRYRSKMKLKHLLKKMKNILLDSQEQQCHPFPATQMPASPMEEPRCLLLEYIQLWPALTRLARGCSTILLRS